MRGQIIKRGILNDNTDHAENAEKLKPRRFDIVLEIIQEIPIQRIVSSLPKVLSTIDNNQTVQSCQIDSFVISASASSITSMVFFP